MSKFLINTLTGINKKEGRILNRRLRKKNHKKYLEDVTLEVSISKIWRNRLFESDYEEGYLLSIENKNDIPKYLTKIFNMYKLKYVISKVKSCHEYFDEGLVIFKVNSKEFPNLVRYSGNNYSRI